MVQPYYTAPYTELDAEGASTNKAANAELGYVAATNEFEHANTYMTDPTVGNDVTILTYCQINNVRYHLLLL